MVDADSVREMVDDFVLDPNELGDDDERVGDLVGALLLVKALAGQASPEEDQWVIQQANRPPSPLETGELMRGCATLMRCWLSMLRSENPLLAVSALLTKLRQLEEITDDDLPTLAGVLTAVALGRSPVRWASISVARFSPGEQQGWIYATWLVADFYDFVTERPRAALDLAERAVLQITDT